MNKTKKLSITIITHSYPNEYFPISGIFIKDQVDHLSKIANVKVLAPKPKSNFILSILKKKWKNFKKIPEYMAYESYEVFRPEYVTYPKRYFYQQVGKNFWKSVKDHLDDETDIFHVHFAYPGGSIIKKIKGIYPRKKVFITVHGNDWHMLKDDPKISKIIYKNFMASDRIIVVSNSLRNDILSYYPELAEKIIVIYNGLNIKSMGNINESRNLFLAKNKIKILMVGAFVKGKGVQVLLKALSELNFQQYKLIIIGNIIDQKYYQTLKELRNALNLKDNVLFLVSLPRQEVYEYMKSCDYFILPSLKEGFGIALIEALFFGKPVISTFSGGPEEIVNSKNGLLIEPDNVERLKNAIIRMDREFPKYDSQTLTADIINRFGMSNIIEKLEKEYRSSVI
jgi:glycosyltransferase involved in cell wall biosynthesis